jgi:ATP-dependent Clp protease ATP-binding subunit ClpA
MAKRSTSRPSSRNGSKRPHTTRPRADSSARRSSGATATARTRRISPAQARVAREKEVLLHLDDLVAQRIVGKSAEIARVANLIRIRRADLDFRPNRPDGAFLLVGPGGVGKTEFALAFGAALLGSDEDVVILDMADYSEEADLDELLVQLFPGTTDTLVEGALTTPVRRNPRAVILLRGLEHAHQNFYRTLLHILDRGRIADAQGEVAFGQTVIFATTRLYPDETELVEQIGFNRSRLPKAERSRRLLEEQFTPELVHAFYEVLYFETLTPDDVRQIARTKVNHVLERLKSQRRGVEVSEEVYDTFIREDEVQRAGARFLNRALEEELFTPLSKYLLEHASARRIRIDVEGGRVVIREPKR